MPTLYLPKHLSDLVYMMDTFKWHALWVTYCASPPNDLLIAPHGWVSRFGLTECGWMGVIYGYRILSITVAILYVPPPRYDAIEHLGRNNVAEYIISMAGGHWWSDSNSRSTYFGCGGGWWWLEARRWWQSGDLRGTQRCDPVWKRNDTGTINESIRGWTNLIIFLIVIYCLNC